MRCRYCNKAISLLRRLNDAEYCSDAHRFADAAEQQLAMQRLAETQPAMQRTQRMTAAKPGRLAVSQGTDSQNMTVVGDHLPFSPPAIESGWQPKPVQEPLHVASTVLFMDRQHRHQATMPWGADSVPVPMAAAVPTRLPAAVLGQLAQMRIVIPRGLTSRLYQRNGWSATPPVILVGLDLQAKETRRSDNRRLKPEPVFQLKWLRHPHRRRSRELVPANRLSSLSMSPASPEAHAVAAKPSGDPLFQPTKACIPVSRLAAAAPPQPVRREDTEEFWTLLAASPLGALLAATHYPAVSPAPPVVGAPVGSEQPRPSAFPALAAVFPNSPGVAGSRQPEAPFGLQAIGAPASVAILNRFSTSRDALEIPIAPQRPERRAKPASRAMDTTKTVLPVLPPPIAPGLNFLAKPAAVEQEIVIAPPAARPPKSKNAPLAQLSLHSSGVVLDVPPPKFAAGRHASFWDGAWSSPRLVERLPVARYTFQHLSLIAAPGGPIPMPEAAGARALPNVSGVWFPAVVAARQPASRVANGIRKSPSIITPPCSPVPMPKAAGARALPNVSGVWFPAVVATRQPASWASNGIRKSPSIITPPCSPVPMPKAAGARALPNVSGVWFPAVVAARQPASRVANGIQKSPSLITAPDGPIPKPKAAGARPMPNVSGVWFPAIVAARQPASRVANGGNGIPIGGRVDCDLRPDPIDSVRRPYCQQILQTVVRVRPPRHSRRLVSRYASAECVALTRPAGQVIPWCAAIVSGTDLSPNPVFPLRAKPAQSKALRHIPVRLFPVPRAKPTAKPGGGKPRVIGMDLWASPPAIRAPRIPFDDGKPRVRRDSTERLTKELRERLSSHGLRSAWTKASRLPSDLKWIAMVVPLILGIWVLARPASSEPASSHIPVSHETAAAEPAQTAEAESRAAVTPVSAPPVREKTAVPRPGPTPAVEPTRWEILTARIAGRGSVDLIEDFHSGLSQWEGRGEWARSWSYDRSGTVRPGQMAIFQPTIALKDYTVEMKASIERRSIQWVVRASGPQNYHFARLNVTPGAPLTKLEFERWSVVNGRTGRATRLPLPHGGANQTLYTIRLEVKGDSITTYLQDQVIDTFSDPRLPEGGIGLIGAHDDRARIYGLHVSHQNDFLGKLCSFLAPRPINNQGSD